MYYEMIGCMVGDLSESLRGQDKQRSLNFLLPIQSYMINPHGNWVLGNGQIYKVVSSVLELLITQHHLA